MYTIVLVNISLQAFGKKLNNFTDASIHVHIVRIKTRRFSVAELNIDTVFFLKLNWPTPHFRYSFTFLRQVENTEKV